MVGRRAAELVGVLVASLITSFVTGLAIAAPRDPVLYIVGALVPLGLLLVYWLWLEPRAAADRLRARRLSKAVEDAFELTQPQTDASAPREAARRAFYDRLDLSDLFEADHIEASTVLGDAYDAGKALLDRLDAEADPSAALIADIGGGRPGRQTRSRSPADRVTRWRSGIRPAAVTDRIRRNGTSGWSSR